MITFMTLGSPQKLFVKDLSVCVWGGCVSY